MTAFAGADLAFHAEATARRLHAGQTDKMGREYDDAHLAPVAALLEPFGPEFVAAGWLHDALEDTPATPAALADAGIPERVVRIVEVVTRRPSETYSDFVARCARDRDACVVKLADNSINLARNAELAEHSPRVAANLKRRYETARAVLLGHTTLPDHVVKAMAEAAGLEVSRRQFADLGRLSPGHLNEAVTAAVELLRHCDAPGVQYHFRDRVVIVFADDTVSSAVRRALAPPS